VGFGAAANADPANSAIAATEPPNIIPFLTIILAPFFAFNLLTYTLTFYSVTATRYAPRFQPVARII
jgi:hypothetical protein